MRNCLGISRGMLLIGLVGFVSSVLSQFVTTPAIAQGSPYRQSGAPALEFDTDHKSTIRFTERDRYPIHKGIRVARSKSVLVELSRDLRDVVVSNPEIIDAVVQSSNRVYLISKKQGQANVFFFDQSGQQIVTLEVESEHDTSALDALFRRLIPGSNIKAEMMHETIILTGSVRSPVESSRASDLASRFIATPNAEENGRHPKKVINMLQVEGEEQVMLQVQVAEVQRSVLKQLGVNLGASITSGNFSIAMLTENALPLTAGAGLGRLPIPGIGTGGGTGCTAGGILCNWNQGPSGNTFGNSGVATSWGGGHQQVSQALRLLERNQLLRTLAEPNLTAISGEAAKFLAGGEYPVPTVDSTGKQSVTYKEFGISVAFTPVVLSEGRISLKISTQVSELSDVGAVILSSISIPALKKREANSTVELPSGGTLAMAGLISEDTRKNIDGIPGVKDLPILGTLFRSQDYIKRETELVVLVTPYIVRPTAKQNLAKPTDGLAAATDMKANFLGHMNRIYGRNVGPVLEQGGVKDGNVGFIVD